MLSYHKDDCMYFVLLSLSKCKRPYHIFCSLVDTGNRFLWNSSSSYELYPGFYPEHLQLPSSLGSLQHFLATKSLVRPVLLSSLSYWNCLCLTDNCETMAYDVYLVFQLIHLSNVAAVVTFCSVTNTGTERWHLWPTRKYVNVWYILCLDRGNMLDLNHDIEYDLIWNN